MIIFWCCDSNDDIGDWLMAQKLMIIPYSSQIMSIQEKEAVLSVIGQRIYDDRDSSDKDDSDSDSDSSTGKNKGWGWGWGSADHRGNRTKDKYGGTRRDSIVIYDEVGDNEGDHGKGSPRKSKGRRYELPKPTSKQYNLLASAPRPHPDSKATPNRMHVTIDQYGFKLALATTTNE